MPLNEYKLFARAHARFLAFGFLLAFTSSVGQTFFIGVFGPAIRETFSLSHTQWGGIYMVGTLASALLLPWSGQQIDRVDLRAYTAIVLCGLAAACIHMSWTPSAVILVASIFLLRQFGQGLATHTSGTSMARYMGENRGKAIAIASTGIAFGEAALPVLAVFAIAAIGWRTTYLLSAGAVLLVLPFALFLLRGHAARHAAHVNDHENNPDAQGKTRGEVLRDSRFYLMLPAVVAPIYIITALFFHHLTLAESKNWSALWVTGNYWLYGLVIVLMTLAVGPLIDRFTAARVVPFYLPPIILALLVLVFAQDSIWVLPYMVLLGLSTGVFFPGFGALWAELYGGKHLGAIKSFIYSLGVLASAFGPISVGALLDAGFSLESVWMVFAIYCVVAGVLLLIGLRRFR